MSYLLLKLLHVASVVMFLGNITTGLFWARRAHHSRDFTLISSTFEGIIRSDRLFTGPGVVGILVTGIAAALIAKLPILGTGWIFWPIVLFSISGAAFGLRVAPLQRRILDVASDVASAADSTDQAWNVYAAHYRQWEFWGLIALITPVAALAIMVLKPPLPGL